MISWQVFFLIIKRKWKRERLSGWDNGRLLILAFVSM